MVAVVVVVTVCVFTVKLVLVAPAGTVTLAGVDATDGLLLDKVTTTELDEGLDRLTIPCELEPPATLGGLMETEEMLIAAGFTVSVAYFVTPAELAEIDAV